MGGGSLLFVVVVDRTLLLAHRPGLLIKVNSAELLTNNSPALLLINYKRVFKHNSVRLECDSIQQTRAIHLGLIIVRASSTLQNHITNDNLF